MSSQQGYMNGQNTLRPEDNKFHVGNGRDGKHYWLTPPAMYAFGSVMHGGRKKGITAWIRKAIAERRKGKLTVIVYPLDKWVLMILEEILGDHGEIRNLGDVKWLATEDGSEGRGTGRHIAAFVLRPTLPAAREYDL